MQNGGNLDLVAIFTLCEFLKHIYSKGRVYHNEGLDQDTYITGLGPLERLIT